MARPLNHNSNEHYLKSLIRHTGIRLAVIADRLKISQQYLSMILSGRVSAPKELEQRLTDVVLTVSRNVLLSQDERDRKRKPLIEQALNRG